MQGGSSPILTTPPAVGNHFATGSAAYPQWKRLSKEKSRFVVDALAEDFDVTASIRELFATPHLIKNH